MVHKRNQWIHSRQWFVRAFDLTWSAWVILNYGASKEPMNLLWTTIYCGLYSLKQHDPSDLESGTSKEPINRIWTRIHWAVHTPWVCKSNLGSPIQIIPKERTLSVFLAHRCSTTVSLANDHFWIISIAPGQSCLARKFSLHKYHFWKQLWTAWPLWNPF